MDTRRALATAMLVFAACGRLDFGARADGGDGMTVAADAPADAAMGMVNAIAYERNAPGLVPQAGALIWSNAADGTVDDVETADANGHASVHVFAGGAVSAAYPAADTGQSTIHTVLAVEPGDTLTFGLPETNCSEAMALGTVTATFPAFGDSTGYFSNTRCNGLGSVGPTPFTYTLYASTSDPIDLVIGGYDTVTFTGAIMRLAVPFENGTSFTFTTADWQAATIGTIGIVGFPADATTATVTVTLATGPLQGANGGVTSLPPTVTDGALTASIGYVPAAAALVEYAGCVDVPTGVMCVDDTLSSPQVKTLATLPPVLTLPGFDIGARTLTWADATDGPADLVAAEVFLVDPTMTTHVTWSIWAPATAERTTLAFPELPAAAPAIDASWSGDVRIDIDDFDAAMTWQDVRTRPEWRSSLNTAGDSVTYSTVAN